MDNEILNWITKHSDIVLILEGDPYFVKEFTVEMRFHNFPERIKYRINSLMAEHIIEILDQMRKELIGAEIIEKEQTVIERILIALCVLKNHIVKH